MVVPTSVGELASFLLNAHGLDLVSTRCKAPTAHSRGRGFDSLRVHSQALEADGRVQDRTHPNRALAASPAVRAFFNGDFERIERS